MLEQLLDQRGVRAADPAENTPSRYARLQRLALALAAEASAWLEDDPDRRAAEKVAARLQHEALLLRAGTSSH